jgi:putative tryptophan/tyrosine transport system substrate-binding protein
MSNCLFREAGLPIVRAASRLARCATSLHSGVALTRPAQWARGSSCRHGVPAGILVLSTFALLFFTGASAQVADKVYRVGVLAPEGMHPIESFKERLRQLGWVEGRNIRFDYRSAEGDDTRQPALAAELVALPVDLMLTWGTRATLAAEQATATIPIVMASIGDPVAVGVVPSLAHPGGNVTGFSSQNFELEEKRFELLRELVPGMTRVVTLGNIGNLYADFAIKRIKTLVDAAGLKFEGVKIDPTNALERGLADSDEVAR